MDVRNGLCLNVLHHVAFDRGYMGIDEDRKVMYSPRLHDDCDRESVSKMFMPFGGRMIDKDVRMPADGDYLDYHRKNVFMES